MKFYSQALNPIVWDKDNNKALCQFKGHEYETDDPYIIEKLKEGGYGWEAEQGNGEGQEVEKEPTFNELREEAKTREVEGYGKMNKQELLEVLRGD